MIHIRILLSRSSKSLYFYGLKSLTSMIPQLVPFTFCCQIPLRWKDIDQFGHVNNANYLTFFEVARFYYCRDVNQWDWDQDQFLIASVKVDYLRPLFFPNNLNMYLRISDVGSKSFNFHYAITYLKNDVEKLAATGQSTQVMYDLRSQKSIEIPERLLNQWKAFEKPEFFVSK